MWGFMNMTHLQHLVMSARIPLRVLQALTNLTTLMFDGGPFMYEAVMAGGLCPLLQTLSNLVNLNFTQSNLFACQVQCINTMTQLRSVAFGTCKLASLTLLCALTGLQHIRCWCRINGMLCTSELHDTWSHSRRHKCLNQQCLSVDTNSSRQSSSDLEQPEISMFTLSSDTDGDGDDAAGDDTSDMP